jgi:predicted nucleic acid-binding Zn ribbon protein
MPIYTFRCLKCGKDTVATLKVHQERPTECEQPVLALGSQDVCDGKLRRVYDVPDIIYHGSGFYVTDKVLYENDPEDPDNDDDYE